MYEIHFDINPPKLTCKKYFTLDPDVTVNFIIIIIHIIILNGSIYFLHFIINFLALLLCIRKNLILRKM